MRKSLTTLWVIVLQIVIKKDNDRKIRELCQQTHEKFCLKVNKSIAPHLKTIMPYWILAQSDTHLNASRIAENLFKSIFNEQKQPEAVYMSKDEILNVRIIHFTVVKLNIEFAKIHANFIRISSKPREISGNLGKLRRLNSISWYKNGEKILIY
jgi:hypothetical protein